MGQRVGGEGVFTARKNSRGIRGGRQELHLERQSDSALGDKGKAKAQWPHLLTGVGYC